jgi:hypothetical protein
LGFVAIKADLPTEAPPISGKPVIGIYITLKSAIVDLSGAKIGAGEGIRTLDPDLGKVVLYP